MLLAAQNFQIHISPLDIASDNLWDIIQILDPDFVISSDTDSDDLQRAHDTI